MNEKLNTYFDNSDIQSDPAYLDPERIEDGLQEMRMKGEDKMHQERLARERSLEKVADEYEVVFVHSMTPYLARKESENSILKPNATLQDQIEIMLTIQPPISTSTIKEGDATMWGEVGIFLSGGRIARARECDDGTVAMSPQKRKASQGRGGVDINERLSEDINLRQEIRRAVQKESSGVNKSHNELVVYSPEISGLYVNVDRNIPGSENYQGPAQITAILEEFAMPLYITDNSGKYYRGYIEGGVFKRGEEISYREVLQSSYHISQEKKEKNLERWTDTPPFNLDFYLPEKKIYNHIQTGVQIFRKGECDEKCLRDIDKSNESLTSPKNENDMQYLVGPLWLHGYAMEATKSERVDLSRIAEELATKYIPKEMFETFLSKRVNREGKFIVKKEDFLQ